jgi:alpha-galactosidase
MQTPNHPDSPVASPSTRSLSRPMALRPRQNQEANSFQSTALKSGFVGMLLACCVFTQPAEAESKKLKVFILAGQSNMVGHANNHTIPYLKTGPYIPTVESLMSMAQQEAYAEEVTYNNAKRAGENPEPLSGTREERAKQKAVEMLAWMKGLLESEKQDVKRLSDRLIPDVTAGMMDDYFKKQEALNADTALSRGDRDAQLAELAKTIPFATGKRAYIAAFGECEGGAKAGPAGPGFGASKWKCGPEYGFAMGMEQLTDAPVLVIKVSWGGKSLTYDFRPPSAPDFKTTKAYADAKAGADEARKRYEQAVKDFPQAQEKYKADLAAYEEQMKTADEKTRKSLRKPAEPRQPIAPKPFAMDDAGSCWRNMVDAVGKVLADPGKYHPQYDAAAGYEMAGFVWFQGFNDQFSDEYHGKYTGNMKLFIEDVRKTFKTPAMPFVIGVLGTSRTKAGVDASPVSVAQRAAAALPEFKGNVAAVESYLYYTQEIYPIFTAWRTPQWDSVKDLWGRYASDRPYHYLGSGKFFVRLGDAFATAMDGMQKKP